MCFEFYQVLWEITAGALGTAPAAVTETPGTSKDQREVPEVEEDPDELEEMQNRLEALRS